MSMIWEDGDRGCMSGAGRRAVFERMNERFLDALKKHHGPQHMSIKPRPSAVPKLPPVRVLPPVPPLPAPKVVAPLSVGLLDDIEEAELVQIKGILRRESVRKVVEAISEKTGIPPERIVSVTRNKAVVAARHWAFYELQQAGFSLTQMGRMFQKDHTTVLHGIRKHMKRTGIAA